MHAVAAARVRLVLLLSRAAALEARPTRRAAAAAQVGRELLDHLERELVARGRELLRLGDARAALARWRPSSTWAEAPYA